MGKPYDRISFDAFTPTGSGPPLDKVFPKPDIPPHVARYKGRPPYMTDAATQAHLRRKGDVQ
jgi:hypothetical protein